ncbi:MAG TPA: hypothetical protein VH475_27605 [Tepidisphaeraceae bacterium]|jgi:hypothetical protein
MRQDVPLLRAVPARVVGLLSRDEVHVTAYPDTRADEPIRGGDGGFYHSKFPVPRDVWPHDLLRANADVWLIYQSDSVDGPEDVIEVCARIEKDPPEKYRAALAESDEIRSRELKVRLGAAAAKRASKKSSRGKWWQFWK